MNTQELRWRIDVTEDALSGHDDQTDPVLHQRMVALLEELRNQLPDNSVRPDAGLAEVGRRAGSPAANQYGTFQVYAASERQVAFLSRLIHDRDHGQVKIPTTLEGISKTAASALIDRLIDRPYKAGQAAPVRLASEKQVAFILKLLAEKDLSGTAFTSWTGEVLAQLPMQDASPAIDMLMKLPRKPEVEIKAGAYRLEDGSFVRVYRGQQSRKMLAAMLINITAEDRDGAWQYLGMASRFVKPTDHRLTVEECEELTAASGADHSWCCVCGRRLDDPNSVSRGIGPVCRAKQG